MNENVKYQRNLQKIYMIVTGCNQDFLESYASQVSLRNRIKGLLFCEIKQVDGEFEAWYDVSCFQTLEQIYGVKELYYQDLKQLMVQLLYLFQELDRYLLDGTQICFLPEYIFFNRDDGQFCFLFDYSEKMEKNNINKLAEFLIERICHEEESAVELAYAFYDCASKAYFDLKKLEDYIEESFKKEKKNSEEVENKDFFFEEKNIQDTFLPVSEEENKKKTNILAGIYKVFFKKQKEGKKQSEMLLPEKEFPNIEQIEEISEEKTVYVGKPFVNREHCLVEIKHGKEEIHVIENYPYFIGKEKERVNFCIRDRSISRIHARILEKEGKIFLEDLHSTNGSFVNDLPLIPHDKIEIKRGDILQFGNLEFIFR